MKSKNISTNIKGQVSSNNKGNKIQKVNININSNNKDKNKVQVQIIDIIIILKIPTKLIQIKILKTIKITK